MKSSCARALEKQPELRYQQASVMKTQIETIAAISGAPKVPLPQAPASQKGRKLAITGAILQPVSIMGVLLTTFGMMQAFSALHYKSETNINDLSEVIGLAVVGSMIGTIAFFLGLIFLCISLAVSRYRAEWFFPLSHDLQLAATPSLSFWHRTWPGYSFSSIACRDARNSIGVAEASAPLTPEPGPVPPMPPPTDIFVPVLRWFGVAFSIFVLTILGGAYITYQLLPKIYTATAQIQVLPRELPNQDKPYLSFDPITLHTEFEIMQSPLILRPIIKDLNLDKIWAKRVYHSRLDALPPQDALGYMSQILRLDNVRGTNIIEIAVSSQEPKEAAEIANAVADRYKATRDIQEDQRGKGSIDLIRAQIAEQQNVVNGKRALVANVQAELRQKGIKITLDASDRGKFDLEVRQKDVLTAQEDHDARKVLLDHVVNLSDDDLLSTLDGLGRAQPDIAALRADVTKMETDIIGLLNSGFPEGHPRVVAMRAELKAKQRQITDLVVGLRRAMALDTDMAKSRVALLQKEVDDLTNKVGQENTAMLMPLREAQHELDQQQSVLDALKVRLDQFIAQHRIQQSQVRILTRAEPPEFPSKPNSKLNLVISMMVGFFLSIVIASLVEFALWLASSTAAKSKRSKVRRHHPPRNRVGFCA